MDLLVFISSILILFKYFISGITKIGNVTDLANGLEKQINKQIYKFNLPHEFYQLSIILVILLEIIAPIIIIFTISIKNRYKKLYEKMKHPTLLASILLFLFTILATYLYHFPPIGSHYYATLSNITGCGALLLLGYSV
jgi:uncharacterized membrane protein YphA (DoxX/SURF4 family)